MKLPYRFFILFIFIAVIQTESSGQEIFYYGTNHLPVNSQQDANFIKKIYKKSERVTRIESFTKVNDEWKLAKSEKIKTSNDGWHIIKEKTNTIYPDKIHRKFSINAEGDFDFQEYVDGHLLRTGTTSRMLPLHLKDTITEYYRNGQIKSVAIYENNALVSNENWKKDGTKYIDDLFYSVDKIPEYSLGVENFRNYVIKSLEAKEVDFSQYNDDIMLAWVITDSGELKGAQFLSGQYAGLGKLMLNIVEQLPGKWEPAKLNGRKVNYFMKFPVNFKNNSNHYGFDHMELSDGYLIWN
jgi:hypothetical protein